jgi:hypothetical protein
MPPRPFVAHPVRITRWAEDRSVEHRFCASLVALDDGPDEVLVDEHGRVVAQGTIESLQDRARGLGHEIAVDQPLTSDVDVVGAASRVARRPSEDDCAGIDDVWNFGRGEPVDRPDDGLPWAGRAHRGREDPPGLGGAASVDGAAVGPPC